MLERHVYVHVPFCARRCSYCDFAIAVRKRVPAADFAGAIRAELALRRGTAAAWPIDTLYLGGGTPSKLGADGLGPLIEVLAERLSWGVSAEVTLEVNPEDVTQEAARAWRAGGVNRISLGAQSFDDRVLTWMRRTHDSAAIARAVGALRSAGFSSLSLDLIFGLPAFLGRDWARDLALALELEPSHLSLYGLTVEPRTPLARLEGSGAAVAADEESYELEFLRAHETLKVAGFEHYEVSNYARPGFRARHNSAYWQRTPYFGLGPSAHSFDGTTRRWNIASLTRWLAALRASSDPVEGTEVLSDSSVGLERAYLGLRTADGVAVEQLGGAQLERWSEMGWAQERDGRFALTPAGWLRLDTLTVDLTLNGSR
ncbi:MAG TPA: radical SAM family heme chaperone HemW [Gemmatimonadaceae bacterium]|nr:radical SAM family heme chaperone HemW [Gemmatimonadaceae bacterium]